MGHPPLGDGCAEPAERTLNLCRALHQPLQAGKAEIGAGLTEGDEEAGAGALQPEAAMGVRMDVREGHRRRSAGPSPAAGRGQGPAAAGLA